MVQTPHSSRTAALSSLFIVALLAAGFATFFAARVEAAPSTVMVDIVNFSYNPASITIVIGVNNTVMWTNDDYYTHTVTADDGSFNSRNIQPGMSFTHTFTAAGTFGVHCTIHTYITGTVTVLNLASTSSSTTTTTTTTSTTSSSSTSTQSTTTSTTSSTTSSSSTSTQSTSTSSSAASSSSTSGPASITTTSSTTSNPNGGIPEFPYQLVGVALVAALVLVSYFVVRQTPRPRNSSL